jgi:hypothetical protein
MKTSRSLWFFLAIFAIGRSVSFGQDLTSPEVAQALLKAKNVYVVTGHVRYYKTKALFKKELVDETPFDEPCQKELEKWGRFTLVPDIKSADLVIRAYEKGSPRYVPVANPGTGDVIYGTAFLFLDVWQPSSKRVIWYASKNLGTSWNNNSAVASLVKKLREYTEEQEKSNQGMKNVVGSANPR